MKTNSVPHVLCQLQSTIKLGEILLHLIINVINNCNQLVYAKIQYMATRSTHCANVLVLV